MSSIWIIFIGIALLSYIVQANLNSKFKKFSKIPLANGMTGRDHVETLYTVAQHTTHGAVAAHAVAVIC